MPYSRPQLFALSKKVGRSWRTLQYWASQGCNLNDPESLERFLAQKNRKRTNVSKFRERRGLDRNGLPAAQGPKPGVFEPQGNGDSAAVERCGAQHALARLEQQQEESFLRLQSALRNGDRFEIDACQTYWPKVAETLRRLDLSIELARRDAEEQVTKRLACDVALAIADWLRISFAVFLSSEARPLMGIRDVGEWKHYAFERFRSILHLTVRNSLNTNSPIPGWATSKVVESWNIPTLDADGN